MAPFNVLEVGAGTGLFSVAQAKTSNKRFLAIDVKADRLQKGARRAEEERLKNIEFLRARIDQLDELVLPRSLDTIWITFPDPFPRERSAKHRLMHTRFLALYEKWLALDGALYFKTDAHSLFEWSLERLVQNGWSIEKLSFDLHDSILPDEYKYKTTYEERYIREGKPIGFVKASPPIR